MTAQIGQNTLKIHIPVQITPTKHIKSYIVIYQNVRATHPEVWEPLYIPFDLILCPPEFFHAVILDIEPWFWTVSYPRYKLWILAQSALSTGVENDDNEEEGAIDD